jgi:DNA mismatch repair protein MutS2
MIPNASLELLEFHKVLKYIADFAHSDASRSSILDIRPLDNRDDVALRLGQIADIRRLYSEGKSLGLYSFSDISPHIATIKPEGAVLEAIELADFISVLDIASGISLRIRDRFELSQLRKLAAHLTGFPDILKILKKSIDNEGNILDSASPLLADLRAQTRRLEVKIRKKLEEIVRDERLSVFLQDDFVTTRSGRWVIPVRMDSKGMVPGVVHDISKSGETAFIEPLSIINLSNELENLIAEQKAEELRILRNICSMIRQEINGVDAEFRTVVYTDVLHSIVMFADVLNMEIPQINVSNQVALVKARHPLLQLSLQKAGSLHPVVPLEVQLGGDNTVMVITGANAGGKTIAIKTIGLLLLMALSGIPLPADSSTSMPFVNNLLADIGDEQSIESNLSTFSAHMTNISGILKGGDSGTMVLIDELGTGTDPDEGAALACAILKEMRKTGALVFATTHISDIKGFVHRTEGMINASMEFDQETFTPLYKLRVGEPGQSHALEIAKRYGIPESLIEDARNMLGSLKVELDHMISDLNRKRAEYESALNELGRQQLEIGEKNRLLKKEASEIRGKKREILADAYREASELIAGTRRQMNAYLDEIKRIEKSERQKVMKKVEDLRVSVTEKLMEFDTGDAETLSIDEVQKGDVVHIRSLACEASVIDVNRRTNRLKVVANNMEIEVPLTDITPGKKKTHAFSRPVFQTERPEEPVPLKINLVGMRVDEALSQLERFLNDASLAELREIIVIHGIGKRVLSKAIHEYLNDHPLIKSYRDGTPEEGGVGVTIVSMN